MSVDFHSVVIGAGVIGLATAREFAQSGNSVLVLEKAASAGTETSSRNSEVIHAGIYYSPNSLKARLCVEGRDLLYDYCAASGVETKRLGKIIVAQSQEEEAKLQSIHSLAIANGVDDLQWLSSSDVALLEPELRCSRALLSPSTGIVDGRSYMLALQGNGESLGVKFAFNTSFVEARKQEDYFRIKAAGANGELTELSCSALINCAGHGAHKAAISVRGVDPTKLPPRYLARGNYCSVSGKSPFKHLIYPVPVSGALGIHATLDTADTVRLGPDIQWISELDYSLALDLPDRFASAVAPYWPGVRNRVLSPGYCGIRPKIHSPDVASADFSITGEEDHGIPGLVNMFGIESPGLTASLAIAKYTWKTVLQSCQSNTILISPSSIQNPIPLS